MKQQIQDCGRRQVAKQWSENKFLLKMRSRCSRKTPDNNGTQYCCIHKKKAPVLHSHQNTRVQIENRTVSPLARDRITGSAHENLPARNGQRNKVARNNLKSHTKSNQPTANHTTEKHHRLISSQLSMTQALQILDAVFIRFQVGWYEPFNDIVGQAIWPCFVLANSLQCTSSINIQQVYPFHFQCRSQKYHQQMR